MTLRELEEIQAAGNTLKRAMVYLNKTNRLYLKYSSASPYDILNERYWDLVDFVEGQKRYEAIGLFGDK